MQCCKDKRAGVRGVIFRKKKNSKSANKINECVWQSSYKNKIIKQKISKLGYNNSFQ